MSGLESKRDWDDGMYRGCTTVARSVRSAVLTLILPRSVRQWSKAWCILAGSSNVEFASNFS